MSAQTRVVLFWTAIILLFTPLMVLLVKDILL